MIIENAEGDKKQILFQYPEIHSNNAILDELDSLADSIEQNTQIPVTLQQGREALRVALEVMEQIEHKLSAK